MPITKDKIITQITDFNSMYIDYIKCINDTSTCSTYSNYGSIGAPSDFQDIVDTSYNNIVSNLQNMNSPFNTTFDTIDNTIDGGSNIYTSVDTPDTYDDTYNDIIDQNNINVQTRNEIKMKFDELNTLENSIHTEKKNKYDATIYTNIILTTLITSGVYILFIHL
jgi:hypothetical protein